MIDYFIIVYLMKRFGYDKRFDAKTLKYYKIFLFSILTTIGIIRMLWFNVDLIQLLYIGPFYYIGHLELLGLIIVTIFFYMGMLLLPFVLIGLTILGLVGGTFLPGLSFDSKLEAKKEECLKYSSYLNSIKCSHYHDILAYHFDFENYIKLEKKLLQDMYDDFTYNPLPDCDPIKDRKMLEETGMDSCSGYLSRKDNFLVALESFLMQLKKINPRKWYRYINSQARKRSLPHDKNYRSYGLLEWSNEECIKKCEWLPEGMRKIGGYSSSNGEFALSVTGKTLYPLNCKWRCESRREILDLQLKYAKLGCDVSFSKVDGRGAVAGAATLCTFYARYLRENGEKEKSKVIYKKADDLNLQLQQWIKEEVPVYYNGPEVKNLE